MGSRPRASGCCRKASVLPLNFLGGLLRSPVSGCTTQRSSTRLQRRHRYTRYLAPQTSPAYVLPAASSSHRLLTLQLPLHVELSPDRAQGQAAEPPDTSVMHVGPASCTADTAGMTRGQSIPQQVGRRHVGARHRAGLWKVRMTRSWSPPSGAQGGCQAAKSKTKPCCSQRGSVLEAVHEAADEVDRGPQVETRSGQRTRRKPLRRPGARRKERTRASVKQERGPRDGKPRSTQPMTRHCFTVSASSNRLLLSEAWIWLSS